MQEKRDFVVCFNHVRETLVGVNDAYYKRQAFICKISLLKANMHVVYVIYLRLNNICAHS